MAALLRRISCLKFASPPTFFRSKSFASLAQLRQLSVCYEAGDQHTNSNPQWKRSWVQAAAGLGCTVGLSMLNTPTAHCEPPEEPVDHIDWDIACPKMKPDNKRMLKENFWKMPQDDHRKDNNQNFVTMCKGCGRHTVMSVSKCKAHIAGIVSSMKIYHF